MFDSTDIWETPEGVNIVTVNGIYSTTRWGRMQDEDGGNGKKSFERRGGSRCFSLKKWDKKDILFLVRDLRMDAMSMEDTWSM